MSDRDRAFQILQHTCGRPRRPEECAGWDQASPLTRELVLTTIRHRGALAAWTDQLCQKPPSRRVRPLIEIGLAQLLLLDGIPPHAAVHETLETGKRFGFKKGVIGFVNALLRRVLREEASLRDWMANQPLHIRTSHPQWLVEGWIAAWGPDTALSICEWNQQRSRTFVRRTQNLPKKRLIAETSLSPVPEFPGFFQLERGNAPTSLPGFAEGAWYVQDPSTSIAPSMLNAREGERILDACAAPGGKTALLAEAVGHGGRGIVAADPKEKRIRRLRENLLRLNLDGVEVRTGELPKWRNAESDTFDAILLDVPCSNTGVLQRRPDVKETLKPEQVDALADLQYRLLEEASPLVKSGGRIVYSTCSIEPAETTALVEAWLRDRPGWRLTDSIRLFPGERGCDGCYAARLERVG